jgi:DNA-binding LytR/AlgR family response regulator
MILNCVAIDDEPVSLNLICSYIEQTPFLNLIGRFSNAVEALKLIHNSSVQVMFLDIRMADLSGIELSKIIEETFDKNKIRIVFTTAYDQYAIESYKVDALDYLLKPFNFVDFSRAAKKAQNYFDVISNYNSTNDKVAPTADSEKQYLYLKVEYQLVKVDVDDILYIEGLKDYVKFFLASEPKPILTILSLKKLEEKLPANNFMRLHRSFIVALDKVKSVTRNSVQIGQTTIPVTEQYKDVFQHFLNKWV